MKRSGLHVKVEVGDACMGTKTNEGCVWSFANRNMHAWCVGKREGTHHAWDDMVFHVMSTNTL